MWLKNILPIIIWEVKSPSCRCLYRMSAIHASRPKVVTSPRDAAIGVATLSGFTFSCLEIKINWSLPIQNHNFFYQSHFRYWNLTSRLSVMLQLLSYFHFPLPSPIFGFYWGIFFHYFYNVFFHPCSSSNLTIKL